MLYNSQYGMNKLHPQVKIFLSSKYFKFTPIGIYNKKDPACDTLYPGSSTNWLFYPFGILGTLLNSVLWLHHTLPSGHTLLAVLEQRYILKCWVGMN